jgi:hypothetical protein
LLLHRLNLKPILYSIFQKENATTAFLAALATFAAVWRFIFQSPRDTIWQKYTFIITILLMGAFHIYHRLSASPQCYRFYGSDSHINLKVLQALAIDSEYGGAAVYVAEHAPVQKRVSGLHGYRHQ